MKRTKFVLGQRVQVSGEVCYGGQWIRVDSEGTIEDIRQKNMSITLDMIDGDSKACVTVNKKYIFPIEPSLESNLLSDGVCLNDELKRLVDKHVSHHQEDLEYDIDEMSNPKNGNHFYLYLRECGTSFIRASEMFVIQSRSYINAINFMEKAMVVLEIHITNRINGKLFGTVKKIDLDTFVNNILENKKDMLGAEIEVTLRDGQIFTNTSYSKNPLEDFLRKLNLVREQVKEYFVIKYLVE